MKNTLKSVAVLTVIAVICAGLLTVANYFWKVEEPQGVTAELLAVFREMVDDESAEFYEIEIGGLGLNDKIKNAYKASAGQNQDIVIINSEGVAGSYGTVQMLTAINTGEDKIIAVKIYSNDTDRKGQVINPDAFRDLDNSALQNAKIDVESNATVTGNAMIQAVKLAMEQYVAKKQEILNAPAKVYDLLTVRVYLKKGSREIEPTEEIGPDDSIKIVVEIASTNVKKANPKKVSTKITVLKNGAEYTSYETSKEIVDNKVIYTLTPKRTTLGSYQVNVEATIKGSTSKGSISFEIKEKEPLEKEPLELKVIKRMFEGTTEVTVVEEGSNNEVVYKNNLDNYVYAVINEEYKYDDGSGFSTGVSNIFIAFDEDGKIAKIDGDVTNTINFPLADYLAQFINLDAATLADNPDPADINIDGVTQATWTTNAVYDAVVKICQFYLAGE